MLNDIQRPTQHRDIWWCVLLCIIVHSLCIETCDDMCMYIYMQHMRACDVYTVIFTPNIILIRVFWDSQRSPFAWRSSKFSKVYHETKIEDSAFHVLHPLMMFLSSAQFTKNSWEVADLAFPWGLMIMCSLSACWRSCWGRLVQDLMGQNFWALPYGSTDWNVYDYSDNCICLVCVTHPIIWLCHIVWKIRKNIKIQRMSIVLFQRTIQTSPNDEDLTGGHEGANCRYIHIIPFQMGSQRATNRVS